MIIDLTTEERERLDDLCKEHSPRELNFEEIPIVEIDRVFLARLVRRIIQAADNQFNDTNI